MTVMVRLGKVNLLFDHVIEEVGWDDSDGDSLPSVVNDLGNLLVLHSYHVLTINLK